MKYMYFTLMDSLAKNVILTSTPLSLQTANKNNVLNEMFYQMPIYVQVLNASNSISRDNGTGLRSAVRNVSGYRCVSDCRSRGGEFDPGPVPYFRGD